MRTAKLFWHDGDFAGGGIVGELHPDGRFGQRAEILLGHQFVQVLGIAASWALKSWMFSVSALVSMPLVADCCPLINAPT